MTENTGPADLGIDVDRSDQQLYRWFLASLGPRSPVPARRASGVTAVRRGLFGRNIRQSQAAKTYHVLIEHGMTSPKHFADLGRERLRRVLDEGGYDRFDHQMADELHEVMSGVQQDWGSVHHLVASAEDRAKAEQRMTAYKGVGPTTARIFLDEVPADVYGTA